MGMVEHIQVDVQPLAGHVGGNLLGGSASSSSRIPVQVSCRAKPQFLHGRSASSPYTNALARRRGVTRRNRPATRLSNSSSPACHLAGDALWPAATV
jgi:hypothetical protein